ncbi:unnamed protein product [Diamesa hyperborea]
MWYLNVKIWLCLTFMLLCCCWSIYCGKLIEEENIQKNNDSHNDDEPSAVVFNDIHLDEVISANEENNDDSNIEETNEQYTVEHIESENEKPFNDTAINHDLPLVLVSKEPIVEMLPNLVTSNNSLQNVEDMERDETRNHIMKPSNKFANALNFLAARLKKLLYYSTDKNRIESKISPQLSSLGRFLNLFTIIKFDNVPCTTARKPLRQLSGTCYHEIECLQLGGIAVDRCAKGFGVCCVFKAGCNTITQQNVTYFESPKFPRAYQRSLASCILTILIPKIKNVKQVLLEFLFFELLAPKDGDCVDDKLIINGKGLNTYPIICGIATGQHMYIEVGDLMDEKLTLTVITQTTEDRAFSIKITQLIDNLAPRDCLQYFTEPEGIIKTFNYDDISKIVTYRNPSYFNNLNYAICIRRSDGFCTITYRNQIGDREDVFQLINLDQNGQLSTTENQAGAEIYNCYEDFIAVNFVRLCGDKLNDGSRSANFNENTPVTSYMNGPIVVPFKTNSKVVGRGFKLYYSQEKCIYV